MSYPKLSQLVARLAADPGSMTLMDAAMVKMFASVREGKEKCFECARAIRKPTGCRALAHGGDMGGVIAVYCAKCARRMDRDPGGEARQKQRLLFLNGHLPPGGQA